MTRLRVAALALLSAVLMASCGLGSPAESVTPSTVAPEPTTFVSIGGVETAEGDPSRRRPAWNRILFRDHLPAQTVFVDLAVSGATAADGVESQLPSARALEPTLVTVWFDDADATFGTSGADYERSLDALVGGLTADGADVIVITGIAKAGQDHADAADAVAVTHGAQRVRDADPDDPSRLAATLAAVL